MTRLHSREDVGEDVGVGVVECGLNPVRELADFHVAFQRDLLVRRACRRARGQAICSAAVFLFIFDGPLGDK